jgi:23S rRNA-intervening sequence protein
MKNFKELRIWQKGMDIAVNCYKITENFPKDERFGITSQITRSGVSIPSNKTLSDVNDEQKMLMGFGNKFNL